MEDLKALVESEPRLPADLRARAKPIFDEMKATLKQEKDAKEWYWKVDLLGYRWAVLVSDVASNRTEAKHIELKKIKAADLTVEQSVLYRDDTNAVATEILDAKYSNHPNWKRATRIFKTAKEDIIAEVREMSIPENRKKNFVDFITSINITLPYEDGHRIGSDAACAATEANAYYQGVVHQFTVCAGLFNSYKSDASIYAVIAHEISHSIDPLTTAERERIQKSPFVKLLHPLIGAKGATIDCARWKEAVDKIMKTAPEQNALRSKSQFLDPMQPLLNCLQPKTTLSPITDEALAGASGRENKQAIGMYSDANMFLTLAQPTVTQFGETKKNQLYMRPDLLTTAWNGGQVLKNANEASLQEIFVQALSCATTTVDGKEVLYKDAPTQSRKDVFRNAIEEASAIRRAVNRDAYNYCGQNCSALASENLSVDSRENFADWMAGRAFNKFIERKKDLREKREATAAAWSLFCEAPSPANDAPDLAEEQKKYSMESHPNNRVRRVSLYTKKNAESAKCAINEKDQGFGLCEL